MSRYQVHQSDANEREIIAYLEGRGAQVEKIHQPVDLLIAFRGATAVAEVKTVRGKLNAAQRAFLQAWRGNKAVLRTQADCDVLLAEMSKRASGATPMARLRGSLRGPESDEDFETAIGAMKVSEQEQENR